MVINIIAMHTITITTGTSMYANVLSLLRTKTIQHLVVKVNERLQ